MSLKSVKSDLPYPSLKGICPDRQAAVIVSPAYAGMHSELSAILQYIFHHYYFKDCYPEIADLLEGIAICEMTHLDMLGEMLRLLGTAPVYSACPPEKCRFFNTSGISYATNPKKMLMDNLTGELTAVREYGDMLLKLQNEQVAAVIQRIIIDEELHIEKLKEALDFVNANPCPEMCRPLPHKQNCK